jgi:hypothetical protein
MTTPTLLALCALLLAAPALADERFDHRGSLGLLLGAGAEQKDLITPSGFTDSGLRLDLDLGGTIAIGHDGNELLLVTRASLGGPVIDWSGFFGYRSYFGSDRVHTFFDLDLAMHFGPAITLGPRAGIGIQYELTSVVGAYANLGAQLGFGGAIRWDAELVIGVQLRSYLLE